MKALIPCAGKGTRLRPLTFTNAKPIIPIANKPLVVYAIDALKEVGITDIGIVVGEYTKDIKKILGDGSRYGVKITYIMQDDPKGISHTIMISKDFLGDSPFVMYLGDNLLQFGIKPAVEKFRNNTSNAVLVLKETDKPELYGIAVVENNQVVRLIEKPKDSPSNLAAIGVYVFDKSIHPIIDNLKPSGRGELEITDAIQGLIESHAKVEHCVLDGWWMDAGNPDDMLEANRLVLHDLRSDIRGKVDESSNLIGEVVIGEGSTIEHSYIRGPIIIGKNCHIKDAYIGSYTSIGDHSSLERCEVEYSVIMENCEVCNIEVRIDGSILGKNVTVTYSDYRPKSYKLILSDNSYSELK